MSRPLVSIIIPVLNREKYIVEALSSLMNQLYDHWEAWVVDDNSTDRTIEIVEDISNQDERVNLVMKPSGMPSGANASRNLGMELSRGDYVIFLDSDDLLLEHCLNARVEFMDKSEALDFAVFPQVTISDTPEKNGKLLNVRSEENDLERFLRFGKDIDVPWITSAPIWRSRFLREAELIWDEALPCYQDLFFHIDSLSREPNYQFFDVEPDCAYRVHGNDRIGAKVHQLETLPVLADKFSKMFVNLETAGILNKRSKELFAQSIYFVFILKLIDSEEYKFALKLLKLFSLHGIYEKRMASIIGAYINLRRYVERYPRVRYYLNQIFRKLTKETIYASNHSGYMSVAYE